MKNSPSVDSARNTPGHDAVGAGQADADILMHAPHVARTSQDRVGVQTAAEATHPQAQPDHSGHDATATVAHSPIALHFRDRVAPAWLRRMVGQLRGRPVTPPRGRVDFGELRRLSPIAPDFGYQRGTPVDRHYIEQFLERHRADIRGNVLEVGDDGYTRRFGGDRVARSDVLNLKPGDPKTTIVGDLADADHIPDDSFDCIVLTQTLQFVFGLEKAAATLQRILRPGGVLLLTVPGISQIDRSEWKDYWYWALTAASVRQLFETLFAHDIEIETQGNVFVATAFLYGLCASELTEAELAAHDPAYQVLITMRATKPASGPDESFT